mgnify:CR=1 FL=1
MTFFESFIQKMIHFKIMTEGELEKVGCVVFYFAFYSVMLMYNLICSVVDGPFDC